MKPKKKFRATIILLIIYYGCQFRSEAQVCTGSLGDPVVNVTFNNGSNPGNPLLAATTTYNFTSSACPNDGGYTVVSSTSGCFNNTWHLLLEDHTPNDANGYMMLVNASFTPGDFYLDTVKNLCANTTYEFAAWILNVLLPTACDANRISPKLVFNIETITGTILGTYSTGDIFSTSAPAWKQYGLFFTTPLNTNSVVIRLTNTAPGGCGNDIALDDITFKPCGPSVSTFIAGNAQATSADLCKGTNTPVPIIATIGGGYTDPAFQWQESTDTGKTWIDIAGATTQQYAFAKGAAGTYDYRLAVADGSNIGLSSCRITSNLVTIIIHDIPVIATTGNSPVCEGRPIALNATGGTTYAWTGPGGFSSDMASPSLVAQNNSAGNYNVTATDQFGCINTAAITIAVHPKPLATAISGQAVCEGIPVNLQAGGGVTYLWSPATGLSAIDIPNPVASPADSTLYTVVVTSGNNCTDTATVPVNVLKKPTADAGPDKILLKGQPVVLNGIVGGSGIRFSWSPGTYLDDPRLEQPTATPFSDYRYTLSVTSDAGCGNATDEVFIKVYNDIYIPTAFSPNNDGLNDTWRVEALVAVPDAKLMVYNRYGQIIFETSGNSRGWDGTYKGKPLPTGAYAYKLDLKNGRPIKKGMVMIVR